MTYQKTNPNGSATSANSSPVVIASDQATIPVSLASVPSHAVTNAGTFVVQENGAGLTSLQLIDDIIVAQSTALGTTKVGLIAGSVTTAAPTYTTGQINPFSLTTAGALRVDGSGVTQPVSIATAPVLVAGSAIIGKVGIDQTTVGTTNGISLAQIGVTTVATGNGVVSAGVQRVAIASDNTAFAVNATLTAETTKVIGTVNVAASQTIAVTQATASSLNAQVVGELAHDAADSGNPQKIGGTATITEQTAVSASGDRVNASFTSTGKQIVQNFSTPEYFVSGAITTAMTATTSTSLIAAPAAGLRNYITTIIVSNSHATVGTDVIIQDGSGGTTLLTIPAAAVYGGAVITLPIPLRQPTTATAIFCANVTTGASTKVSAVGYKGI